MSASAATELLSEEVEPGILRLTLNRPEKRNPLGPSLIGELRTAFSAAGSDESVRVVVVTGAGAVFSAGGDLGQMADTSGSASGSGVAPLEPGRAASLAELFLTMVQLGKPTIAMVNGHALAGGLGLVAACDLVIASDAAQFGLPEINVGLWPMMVTALLARNVARKNLLALVLLGERIDAHEAERIGLVTRVVPAGELEAETLSLARKLAARSPIALRLGLRAFYDTADMALEPSLRKLEHELVRVLATEDAREGIMAFLERRAPVWKGR